MASFVGTTEEFRRYLGPRFRNLIQNITKKQRVHAICRHCGTTGPLEAARMRGGDRNKIIDSVIQPFADNGTITVDIPVLEKRFKEKHQPLDKTILFLCRDCHEKYDSHKQRSGRLPISLVPPDPKVFREQLSQTRTAEITITYVDGRIRTTTWNATRLRPTSDVMRNLRSRPEFRSGNWRTNGIANVTVRVTGVTAK